MLGANGGALPKIKLITKLGLGGKQGSGEQKVSWVHIQDFCRAIIFAIDNNKIDGPINLTAPNPTNNNSLMKTIRKHLNIPFGLSQNAALLEIGALFLRTETELLLKSRNVYPEKLMEAGFSFKFKTIEEALADL